MSVLLGLWSMFNFVAVDADVAVTATVHLCLVFVSVCVTICLCACAPVSVFCSLSAKCLIVSLSQSPRLSVFV